MLPEPDKMKSTTTDPGATATVKQEPAEVKEEVKEEPPTQSNGTASVANVNGSPSNNLTNGDNETMSQAKSTENVPVSAPSQPVKKELGQTLADVLNEDCDSPPPPPISKPTPAPGRSPGNPQSASMKTAHHSPGEGPASVPTQPPSAPASRAPSRPHSQPTTGADAHFTQQQSQIFVFSTQMANEAAETVMSGQYKNILSYHMDQPSTKKFLQKHPLKISPLNGPPNAVMTRTTRPRYMGVMKGGQGFPPNSSASVAQWVQQQNAHLQEQGYNFAQNMGPHGGMMGGAGGQMRMMQDGFDLDMMGIGSHNPNILSHQKVPNENLTPEQLKRREESLTNLRKIQQMLFPEQRGQMPYGQGGGPEPGGMMPEGMRGQMMPGQEMMSPPHNMMSSQQEMMTSQNMMPSEGMMGSPNSMMGMSQFGGPGGMGPHGPRGPGSHMQNMNPAQREWYRLQHEFYMEKRRHHQQQIAQRMGQPNVEMAGGANGPPPSYYTSIAQKHGSVGINSSTSPSSNGPLGSPPLASQGFDPHDMGMFPQGRPPLSSLEQASMGPGNPGMPPGGGFDPMVQNMPPGGMMPGMGSPIHARKGQAQFHRAGNPEPFLPDIPSSQPSTAGGGLKKPPPSYAQSQKRRRSEIEEEIFKNLQPAPSPQQINYLNQFEGQELTITKQLNTAYRDPSAPNESQSHPNQFSQNHVPQSPMHVTTSKGPMSNSSQTSSIGQLSSPGPMPGPSPMSGANMRLSHFDPTPQNPSVTSTSINSSSASITSSAPPTLTSKSSMSNITSSSLADLAKGVEHLSNQMQQNMMQGGPFHSIQMQGQQAGSASSSGSVSQSNNVVCTKSSDISSHTQTTPSVNNTYVNATMSIQQLNIQSVNAPGGPNYNPSMQIQQMNMDHNNMPGGPPHNPAQGSMSSASMSQAQGGAMSAGANNSMSMNKTQFSQHQQVSTQLGGNTMMAQQQSSQQQQQQQPPPQGRPNSPGFPPNAAGSMGNANVQIQAKAPNTIQYLPANPPANQPGSGPPKRPDLEFMQRFAAPLGNVDAKAPTSKMQYYPNPQEQAIRGRMSPFSNVPGGPMGPVGMSQPMMQGNGPSGPDFPPHPMGPGSGSGMVGPADMMGSEPGPGPMGSMHPGMMPGGPESMMPGSMRMSPGVLGMDSMPPSGGMGGLCHQGSPPYSIGREPVMGGGMMQRGMMNSSGPMSDMMPGVPGRMNPMGNYGPRGGPVNSGMRMPGPASASMMGMSSQGMGGGPGGPGFNPGYQQFQQQLYSQGRPPRQMSPMDGMMGGPGGQYMGMMGNMPGP